MAQSDDYSKYHPEGCGLKEQRSGIIVEASDSVDCQSSRNVFSVRASRLRLLLDLGVESVTLKAPALFGLLSFAVREPFLTPNREVPEHSCSDWSGKDVELLRHLLGQRCHDYHMNISQ